MHCYKRQSLLQALYDSVSDLCLSVGQEGGCLAETKLFSSVFLGFDPNLPSTYSVSSVEIEYRSNCHKCGACYRLTMKCLPGSQIWTGSPLVGGTILGCYRRWNLTWSSSFLMHRPWGFHHPNSVPGKCSMLPSLGMQHAMLAAPGATREARSPCLLWRDGLYPWSVNWSKAVFPVADWIS